MPKTKYRHGNVIRPRRSGDTPVPRRVAEAMKAAHLAGEMEKHIAANFEDRQEGVNFWSKEVGRLQQKPQTYGSEAMFLVIDRLDNPPSLGTWAAALVFLLKYPGMDKRWIGSSD